MRGSRSRVGIRAEESEKYCAEVMCELERSHELRGLEQFIMEHSSDSRQGLNKQFTLADLERQSVYNHSAG